MAKIISRGGYGLTPEAYEDQTTGGLVGRLRDLLEQRGAASSATVNQSAESNGSPQGLLGRLLALAANSLPAGGFSQELSSQSKDRNFRQLSRVSGDRPMASSIALGSLSEASQRAPSIMPLADGPRPVGPSDQQYAMGKPTYSQCVDQCLHLLPSPSGDLQSSEFRQCVGKCMGRL